MTQDALESLLRKARKAEPPTALRTSILQQAACLAMERNRAAVVPFRSSPRWAWGLIAAGWVVILSLWSTTPNPLPSPNSPLRISSAQSKQSHPGDSPKTSPDLFFPTLELLSELGLALDSFEPALIHSELRSNL